jgi:hypothetical protein
MTRGPTFPRGREGDRRVFLVLAAVHVQQKKNGDGCKTGKYDKDTLSEPTGDAFTRSSRLRGTDTSNSMGVYREQSANPETLLPLCPS